MRRRRSQSELSNVLRTSVVFLGYVFLPLVILYKLSDRASLRKRNARFASDIADAYVALIARYQGAVSAIPVTDSGSSFDYVEASIEFADRTLRFVRGRGELSVTCNGSPVFSGKADALFRSSSFLEEHWGQLLDADYNQIQEWLRADA